MPAAWIQPELVLFGSLQGFEVESNQGPVQNEASLLPEALHHLFSFLSSNFSCSPGAIANPEEKTDPCNLSPASWPPAAQTNHSAHSCTSQELVTEAHSTQWFMHHSQRGVAAQEGLVSPGLNGPVQQEPRSCSASSLCSPAHLN